MLKELELQNTPNNLLTMAVEKGCDTEQLKQLMDLQERWEKKEAKKMFLSAISKFQTIVPTLKKTKVANIKSQTGASFSYKYADLGSIAQCIKSSLNECGLSYRWEFDEKDNKMKVSCLVSHFGGHTETTTMEGEKDSSGAKNGIQQKGSTHTYLQRYTLIGALGLSTAEEDNDGKSNPPAKDNKITDEEVIDKWKQVINQVKTQIELQALYLKNKKGVDTNDYVKAMFKEKEAALKSTENKKGVELP
jgi:hypothetical protein